MLINLRNALMAGKRTPTAKDYVCNLALWDGIENAGWGTHTDTGLLWVDPVGGFNVVDAYGLEAGAWLQNGFRFTASDGRGSTFYSQAVPMKNLQSWTCECCCCVAAGFQTSNRGIFGNMGNTTRDRGVCGFQYNGSTSWFGTYNSGDLLAVSNNLYLAINTKRTIALVSNNASGKYEIYVDGSKVYEASGTKHQITFNGFAVGAAYAYASGVGYSGREDGITRRFVGDIYCTRVSSRTLTAAEIAANYAIDKARFGLP